MRYTVVVSKYRENVSWLETFDPANVILYDKSDNPIGIPRPNIGRESETFLYYILQHYHDLPEYIVFVQGYPFDHMKGISPETFRQELEGLVDSHPTQSLSLFAPFHEEAIGRHPGLCVQEYYEYLFGTPCPDSLQFSVGCQYIVPKARILDYPRECYQYLYDMICTCRASRNPPPDRLHEEGSFDPTAMNPWTFERISSPLFCERPARWLPKTDR